MIAIVNSVEAINESQGRLKMKEFYLITHTHTQTKTKGNKETLGGIGHISYLDYGDGIIGVCIYPNSLTCTLTHKLFFVYPLYLNKAVFF